MPEHQQTQKSTESKSTVQKQATPRIQAPISHPMAIIQRARINPKSLTSADVLQLQRTIGNRAVGRLLSEIGLIPSKAKQEMPVQRQELVQRQEIPEEEEPLQGKFESGLENETCPSCMQRQEIPEEEEPLQGKLIKPIQRQEPEEDEKLQMKSVMQRQEIPEEEEPLQGKMIGTVQRQEIPEEEEPLQPKRENNTGMPDNLKAGVESLSGIDMSDVRVHYNSSKPAEVGALAYTQGTNIHVAPGQERHLPHEAWHVVQQVQGRVRPTMKMKGVEVSDDMEMEEEADMMGERSLRLIPYSATSHVQLHPSLKTIQRTLNVAAFITSPRIPYAQQIWNTFVGNLDPFLRNFIINVNNNPHILLQVNVSRTRANHASGSTSGILNVGGKTRNIFDLFNVSKKVLRREAGIINGQFGVAPNAANFVTTAQIYVNINLGRNHNVGEIFETLAHEFTVHVRPVVKAITLLLNATQVGNDISPVYDKYQRELSGNFQHCKLGQGKNKHFNVLCQSLEQVFRNMNQVSPAAINQFGGQTITPLKIAEQIKMEAERDVAFHARFYPPPRSR